MLPLIQANNNISRKSTDPLTGMLVTPVAGKVGLKQVVAIRSQATNALLSPNITINHPFSIAILSSWGPYTNNRMNNGSGLLVGGGPATFAGAPVGVMMTAVEVEEVNTSATAAVQPTVQGGQLRITVFGNAGVIKNHYFRSSAAWGYLKPSRARVVDANGNGSDDIVLQYVKPLRSATTATGWRESDRILTRVINLQTGALIKQYADVENYQTVDR